MNTAVRLLEQDATCRIHDMPAELRPREKLARHGPEALDTAELMALFISTGTKKENAIEIGRRLLRTHGSLSAVCSLGPRELAREHGIGSAKASKLAAAFELGRRAARERTELTTLDHPAAIYEAFAPQMAHLAQEQLVVALIDIRLRHAGTHIIGLGTVNESFAHPREILRPVISRGAFGFIMLHNHPSGDASPSSADLETTQRIRSAAELMQVRFVDHVIIGRPGSDRAGYFSFRAAGLLD